MKFFNQILEQFRVLLKEIPPVKRFTIGISALAVMLCLVVLVVWSGRKSYVPLLGNAVDQADRNDVIKLLEKEQVPYRLEGQAVTVPEGERERVIALVTSAGLGGEKGVDFSYLFQADFVNDQGRQDRQYKIKVEEKLQRMLMYFPFVRGAQVQITPGDDTLSFSQDRPAKASVQITLKSGFELAEANVRSIASLVANSWKNLDAKDVVIVDTNTGRGHLLPKREGALAGADELEDQKRKLEAAYQEKVETLIPLVRKVVAVDIKLSRKRMSIKEEDVDPQKRAVVKERSRERSDNSSDKGPAGPGITANVTETIPALVSGVSTSSEETESERENIYSRKTTTTEVMPGDIEELTVAVTLDTEEATCGQDGAPAKDPAESQRNFTRTVTTLTSLISRACNIKDPQNIAISAIPFPRPAAMTEIPAPWGRTGEWIAKHGVIAFLALLVLATLVMMGVMVRRATVPEQEVVSAEEQDKDGLDASSLAEEEQLRHEMVRADKLKDRVEELIKQEPHVAAGLIKRWVTRI